jgi:hypothetical protein
MYPALESDQQPRKLRLDLAIEPALLKLAPVAQLAQLRIVPAEAVG